MKFLKLGVSLFIFISLQSKVTMQRINECITCRLCAGYLIDATTITECLHTCKSSSVNVANSVISMHIAVLCTLDTFWREPLLGDKQTIILYAYNVCFFLFCFVLLFNSNEPEQLIFLI